MASDAQDTSNNPQPTAQNGANQLTDTQQARDLARRLAQKTRKENQWAGLPWPGKKPASITKTDQIDQLLGNLRGTALESTVGRSDQETAGAWDRERRAAHSRADFDDLDISEVEYRRVQLEKVFLVGVYQQKENEPKSV